MQMFLITLSVDTCVEQASFIRWADANRDALTKGFVTSGEPGDTDPEVENCVAIYVLQQFKARRIPA
jgi:hypothetical protein